jgi:hypothetical protein
MSKKPTLGGLVGITASQPAAPVTPPVVERAPKPVREAKVKEETSTVPVRLTAAQRREARTFALAMDRSLQDLFIEGLNMIRATKGLGPLPGTGVPK